MVSKIVSEKINLVHDLVDQGEYEAAIKIMDNLKIRIHDKIALEKLVEHDKFIETEYKKRYDIESKQHGDPLDRYVKSSTFLSNLEHWRVSDRLKHLDMISKEYDI